MLAPSGKLYTGSQYLHVSTDRGDSWTRISPDLTTNNPQLQRQATSGGLSRDNSSAENNTTLYTIAESPKNPDTIWVGTDDGNVQLTRDGGRSWTNLTARLKSTPKGAWVSRIEASPHDEGTAFVTIDDHRRGDMKPYLLVTRDFGASFAPVNLAGVDGYAWVIEQDPVQADLLYLGTEFGLFISIDGGAHWARFAENLPRVAVHDLYLHPRENDLIIATHGRGIYIIDDLSPLRALNAEVLKQDLALLPSRAGIQTIGGGLQDFGGDDEYAGQSLPDVAVISFYAAKRHMFGDSKLEVFDSKVDWVDGRPVASKGASRFVEVPQAEPLREECRHFIEAASANRPALTDAAEGLRVLSVLEQAETQLRAKLGTAAKPDYFVHETAIVDDGVTIGANSVVTGEIPDFSVAVGNPAKVIRRYVDGEGWVRRP